MSKEIPATMTIQEAHNALVNKKLSAKELAEHCLGIIHERDETLHAFLEVFNEEAIQQASAVDKKIGSGETIGMLEGIPLAIKDNILIAGTRTTAASQILANYTASYDAFVIKRLRDAGSIFLGKTNMDEFAMGSSCENSSFGPTTNPHDASRVPGGSSGGSAAAVASGECLGALGSDTGGSIRQPASFCGVVGLKPTYGTVSRSGLMAMASSLDQIGPLARSVEDAELLFNAIAGKDPMDATSVMKKTEERKEAYVAGIPKEYFAEGIDPEVKKIVRQAIDQLVKAGVSVKDISLPHSSYALSCYYIIMLAEASSNLARYDGMRYGFTNTADTLKEVYHIAKSEGFGTEVKRRIIAGTYVLSSGYYDAYYLQAQKVRTLIKQDFDKAFKKIDVLLTPTAPTTAFKIGEKIADPMAMYLSDILTVSVNLAGLPALSVPCGEVAGLPVGLQLIGRPFGETSLFTLGEQYEQIRGK